MSLRDSFLATQAIALVAVIGLGQLAGRALHLSDWYPIEAGPESLVVPNAVRVVCGRAPRSCREELTHLASEAGAEPVHQALEYRIDEWTRWGTPAGKLVASRREGGAQVEIRVSLSGLTAEKAVIEKGRQLRWRIE